MNICPKQWYCITIYTTTNLFSGRMLSHIFLWASQGGKMIIISQLVTLPVVCVQPFGGDGWCDTTNNRAYCQYDGGDCCPSTLSTRKVHTHFQRALSICYIDTWRKSSTFLHKHKTSTPFYAFHFLNEKDILKHIQYDFLWKVAKCCLARLSLPSRNQNGALDPKPDSSCLQ